jgi:hypothetical protein
MDIQPVAFSEAEHPLGGASGASRTKEQTETSVPLSPSTAPAPTGAAPNAAPFLEKSEKESVRTPPEPALDPPPAPRFASSGLLGVSRYRLDFSIHPDTHDIVIQVVDPETDEVVRQVPPEEMVELAARLDEARGSLLQKDV